MEKPLEKRVHGRQWKLLRAVMGTEQHKLLGGKWGEDEFS